jgi:hypothetical protein
MLLESHDVSLHRVKSFYACTDPLLESSVAFKVLIDCLTVTHLRKKQELRHKHVDRIPDEVKLFRRSEADVGRFSDCSNWMHLGDPDIVEIASVKFTLKACDLKSDTSST